MVDDARQAEIDQSRPVAGVDRNFIQEWRFFPGPNAIECLVVNPVGFLGHVGIVACLNRLCSEELDCSSERESALALEELDQPPPQPVVPAGEDDESSLVRGVLTAVAKEQQPLLAVVAWSAAIGLVEDFGQSFTQHLDGRGGPEADRGDHVAAAGGAPTANTSRSRGEQCHSKGVILRVRAELKRARIERTFENRPLSDLLGHPVGAADRRSTRCFRLLVVVLGGDQRVEFFRMADHPLRPVFLNRTGPERAFLNIADNPKVVSTAASAEVQGSGLMVAIRAPLLAQRIDLAARGIQAAVKLPAAPNEPMCPEPQGAGVAIGKGRADHQGGFHLTLKVVVRRLGSLRDIMEDLVDELTRRHRPKNEMAVQVPKQAIASPSLFHSRVCREPRERRKVRS